MQHAARVAHTALVETALVVSNNTRNDVILFVIDDEDDNDDDDDDDNEFESRTMQRIRSLRVSIAFDSADDASACGSSLITNIETILQHQAKFHTRKHIFINNIYTAQQKQPREYHCAKMI